jgi:F-type H+-transporting ATPase subunit gamma
LFVRRSGTRRALLLVTSDKGLCGAFNTNLIRHTLQYLRQHSLDNVQLFVVGRKGRDYFRRMGTPIAKEYANILNALTFAHAELITQELVEAYQSEPYVAVDMLYNEFKSVIQQRLVVKQLLPLEPIGPGQLDVDFKFDESRLAGSTWPDYIYEPAKEQLLEALIPRFLRAQVFRVLLESCAAELGARVTAMDNATNNAADLTQHLTLRLNRTRQASITKEILEVVSGAEALA